jgi:hypothetical protein
MNIEPKKRFIQDESARLRHAQIVGNPEFQDWLTIAFAEYALNLPASRGAQEAMDANSRRDGACEFISVFLNLSSQFKAPVRVDDNLPHRP